MDRWQNVKGSPRLDIPPHAQDLSFREELSQRGIAQGHNHIRFQFLNQRPQMLSPALMKSLGGIIPMDVVVWRLTP